MDAVFYCSFCFEPNSIFVDPTGGGLQRYVEDCQVCCRANTLSIAWDDTAEAYTVDSEPEGGV
ncbi:MAG: CPXCG motif-containing cysteine-rich protein [Candidatus Melainabacteria bacterium]|nr:CPXCG motif-containing cysteine-rich protein [Candidatus Melainabacteria bacterium]